MSETKSGSTIAQSLIVAYLCVYNWISFQAMKKKKILQKLLSGSKNVSFSEMRILTEAFGFKLSRVKGSHHIFVHEDVPELINLQNVDGKVKNYQVKQFLEIIEKYNLQLEDSE
jgi:predicted RNA binding protein YcfA (HicA-like mRNA interferase family)